MATSTTQPPAPISASSSSLVHNVSLGALIVCPIIMLLPPRKLDTYTLALLTGTFIGGNQLSAEYTGVSIIQRFTNRVSKITESATQPLPPKAREMQTRLREEKARREAAQNGTLAAFVTEKEKDGVLKELEGKRKAEEDAVKRGVLERVWLGGEGEDWKVKRDQREKEALEDGRGYGGLIMDQIWEVWSWGKGKDKNDEVKDMDEKFLAERKASKDGPTRDMKEDEKK